MGIEADVSVYDEMHATADAYNVPVSQSFYYPMFHRVASEVRKRGLTSVIEVGCGSGGLAELVMTQPTLLYRGFDFSSVAVQNAIRRTGKADAFFIGDAFDPKNYAGDYDGIICTEVLEHITRELEVMAVWRPGVECICSVPNFDHSTHVRHFKHEREVRARYSALLEIDMIVRVARPVLRGKTVREYLRQVRWARNEPKKLLGMLGINTFDWYAGWFVFTGRRRR